MTGENLVRQRTKTMAHLSLKHVSLLGVVRMKQKAKKKKKQQQQTNPCRFQAPSGISFLFDEAIADEEEEDDNDDDDDDDDDDIALEEEEVGNNGRGLSESEEEDSDSAEEEEEKEVVSNSGDIGEQLVQEFEHDYDGSQGGRQSAHDGDHTYVKVSKAKRTTRKARYKYSFLFSVVVSGVCKKIKNSLPNAVATLSNSKTIILSHIHRMLECLDPALAEICYIDTDSCIWSFTHERLEDNLLADKKELWKSFDIIADEQSDLSCHGKLKLEGTFKAGFFKALKIYRLFSTSDFETERKNKTCYTRCKGVNRNIAKIIPNKVFDKESTDKVVVHRSCLRPSRTGEMLIAHECKSLAAPFNLKRHVTADGIHTFPLSFVADGNCDEALSEDL
jgi:hypothetical protein